MLHAAKQSLDPIAKLVKGRVVRGRVLSGPQRGNDRSGANLADGGAETRGIVSAAGDDMAGGLADQQIGGVHDVAGVAGGDTMWTGRPSASASI